jgi:hypothetical protein
MGVGRRRYANDEERRLAAAERRKVRTMNETRALAATSRQLHCPVASELCVTNQRATNPLQHFKVRARLSNEAREARRLADVELHALNREFENEGAREIRRLADAELHVKI